MAAAVGTEDGDALDAYQARQPQHSKGFRAVFTHSFPYQAETDQIDEVTQPHIEGMVLPCHQQVQDLQLLGEVGSQRPICPWSAETLAAGVAVTTGLV